MAEAEKPTEAQVIAEMVESGDVPDDFTLELN
jgi:hypothetical protein